MIPDFFSKFSPQEKKITYITAAVLVLATLDALFLRPVLSRLKSLEEETESTRYHIQRDLRFLAYKDRILKEEEALQQYFQAPQGSEDEIIANFLKGIEELARDAAINLVKVNPGEAAMQKGYIEYSATLDCDGPLNSMTNFIYSVNTASELMKVVHLNVLPKKTSADEIQVSMTIKKMIIDPNSFAASGKKGESTDEAAELPESAAMDDAAPEVDRLPQKKSPEDSAQEAAVEPPGDEPLKVTPFERLINRVDKSKEEE